MELVDTYILPHWPFFAVVLVFAVIGQFTSKHVFTRDRAYTKGRFQWLWWWGRESLSVHPLLAGGLLGLVWFNPEHADPVWHWTTTVGYFAFAGAISLFGWALLKGWLKRKGVTLSLPGESVPPKP